jgi:hypothetical protein
MIAAGISDNTTSTFFVGERCDLVVSASQLEGANRLQIFRLEKKLAAVPLQRN